MQKKSIRRRIFWWKKIKFIVNCTFKIELYLLLYFLILLTIIGLCKYANQLLLVIYLSLFFSWILRYAGCGFFLLYFAHIRPYILYKFPTELYCYLQLLEFYMICMDYKKRERHKYILSSLYEEKEKVLFKLFSYFYLCC